MCRCAQVPWVLPGGGAAEALIALHVRQCTPHVTAVLSSQARLGAPIHGSMAPPLLGNSLAPTTAHDRSWGDDTRVGGFGAGGLGEAQAGKGVGAGGDTLGAQAGVLQRDGMYQEGENVSNLWGAQKGGKAGAGVTLWAQAGVPQREGAHQKEEWGSLWEAQAEGRHMGVSVHHVLAYTAMAEALESSVAGMVPLLPLSEGLQVSCPCFVLERPGLRKMLRLGRLSFLFASVSGCHPLLSIPSFPL